MTENFNKDFKLPEIDERKSRLVCLVVLSTFLLSGCAVATAARNGQRAEQIRDYDRAVFEYTKALSDNPDNRDARQALDRVKLRAAQEHYTRGRRLEAAGNLDEALMEFQLASELNPGWGDVEDALRSIRVQLRNRIAISREGKTRLEALIDRSRNLPPDEFDFPFISMPIFSYVVFNAGFFCIPNELIILPSVGQRNLPFILESKLTAFEKCEERLKLDKSLFKARISI